MGDLEKRLDILLHRDPADVQLHRSRQSRQRRVPGNARSKMLNIDPASPRLRMAEAMDFQLRRHRFRGQQNGSGRFVDPAHVAAEGSDERRAGKGWDRTSGFGWCPYL